MSNEQETITNSNESTNTETTEQENQEVQQEAQGQENQVTTEQTKERPFAPPSRVNGINSL